MNMLFVTRNKGKVMLRLKFTLYWFRHFCASWSRWICFIYWTICCFFKSVKTVMWNIAWHNYAYCYQITMYSFQIFIQKNLTSLHNFLTSSGRTMLPYLSYKGLLRFNISIRKLTRWCKLIWAKRLYSSTKLRRGQRWHTRSAQWLS